MEIYRNKTIWNNCDRFSDLKYLNVKIIIIIEQGIYLCVGSYIYFSPVPRSDSLRFLILYHLIWVGEGEI